MAPPASAAGAVGVNLALAALVAVLVPVALAFTTSPAGRVPRMAVLATVWAAGAACCWLALRRHEPDTTPSLLGGAWLVVGLGLVGALLAGRGVVSGLPVAVPLVVTAGVAAAGAWSALRVRRGLPTTLAGLGLLLVGAAHVTYLAGRQAVLLVAGVDVLALAVVAGALMGLAAAAMRVWQLVWARVSRIEEQREAARRELASVQAAQAEMVHETRNVLLVVDGASRGLERDEADPDERRRLEQALWVELRLLRHLTERARNGRHARSGVTHVREIVDRQVRLAAERGVEVALHVDGDPVTTTGADVLEEVVLNLLLNAERHGRGEQVGLTASRDPASGEVVVCVTDRGPGLDADRLSRSEGLGLHISRRLAASAGGRLTVRPRTGGGVRATLTLPGAPALPAGRPVAAAGTAG